MTDKKPKELVVISGKGGTGKTSITAALAQCMPSKVLADCDVDAADLHLLMDIHTYCIKPFHSGHIAKINADKCTNCGLCASLCRFDAIVQNEHACLVTALSCEGCRVCVDACPAKAIEWNVTQNGVWKESQTSQGPLFHARLYPGAENSGKLVSHVREQARQEAVSKHIPFILVDGPPGIGCPVIASVTGASAVLVVTEPTPSGVHDLERVLVLSRHFRIPAYVLINKADLSEAFCQRITECAIAQNAQVIGALPYSPVFTAAQLQGKSVLEAFPDSPEANQIRSMYDYLASELF